MTDGGLLYVIKLVSHYGSDANWVVLKKPMGLTQDKGSAWRCSRITAEATAASVRDDYPDYTVTVEAAA